ncbi:tolloid-like protein 1 [Mizuhopecten yessoensis]|uniref:tolloid-like protein 1 n=1 Tax=Mizuhopecten yessoensis TaxID=6573 RepID=UPI000B457EE1|nr:tolloid-like protein 1 [Mizuhopecten yessoensis]
MKIKIATEFLDLETNYDFLYIFDGKNATYPILGRYTGTTPFALVINGTEAFMALTTDHVVVKSGFRLSYLMVPPDDASDTPSSLNPRDIPRYLWLDGYLDAKNHQFQLPNGEVVSMSTLTLDAAKHSRLCYDPIFDQLKAFADTEYCNTYCETQ